MGTTTTTTTTSQASHPQSPARPQAARSRIGLIVAGIDGCRAGGCRASGHRPAGSGRGAQAHRDGSARVCAGLGAVGGAVRPIQRPAATLGGRAGGVMAAVGVASTLRVRDRAGRARLDVAAGPVRARGLDAPAGPAGAARPGRPTAAVRGSRRAGDRRGRRRLRDGPGVARRQRLSAARPAGRRRRAPARPALHRLREPDRRRGTRSRRGLLRPRLDRAGGGPRHQGLRYDRAGRGWSDATDAPTRRRAHRRRPAHAARPRAGTRAVRAGRPSSAASTCRLRRPVPGRGRGPALLDSTAPKTGPDPADQHHRHVVGRVSPYCRRSLTSEPDG